MKGTHLGGPVLQSNQAAGSRQFFSHLPAHSDPGHIKYYNDFLVEQDFTAADWFIDVVGSSQQLIAANERGGALLVTTPAVDGNSAALQLINLNFELNLGRRAWFESRLNLNAVNAEFTFFVGLMERTTDPDAAQNLVGWQIRTSDPRPLAITITGGNIESEYSSEVGVSGVYMDLGFSWDGAGRVSFFHNRAKQPFANFAVPTDVVLLPSIFLENNDASARAAMIDHLFIVGER